MNRHDKIKFLKNLKAGKATINELLPIVIRHWYGTGDGIWKDEQGNIIPELQIINNRRVHNIFHVDSGIPLATCEEEVDLTPYLQL